MVLRRVGGASGRSSAQSGEVGEMGFFSSCNLFSNPSTRFNKASSTSVFGPRFLGIASGTSQPGDRPWRQAAGRFTIDAGTLKDLACLTTGSQTIAFDLNNIGLISYQAQ